MATARRRPTELLSPVPPRRLMADEWADVTRRTCHEAEQFHILWQAFRRLDIGPELGRAVGRANHQGDGVGRPGETELIAQGCAVGDGKPAPLYDLAGIPEGGIAALD